MLAAGESWASIGETLGCSPDYIQRWKKRFERDRLAGLSPDIGVGRWRRGRPSWKRRFWIGLAGRLPMVPPTGAAVSSPTTSARVT